MGLVDEVLPLEEVRSQSIKKAAALGAESPAAFASIKQNQMEPILEQIQNRLDEQQQHFINQWYADETRTKLHEAIEKF